MRDSVLTIHAKPPSSGTEPSPDLPAKRVTGAWTRLLSDWLDREGMPAPRVRAQLAAFALDDIVPLPIWRSLLEQTAALCRDPTGLGLRIGAGVQPHHLGVLGYLVVASDTLGEAMAAYQRYERLFYGLNLASVAYEGDEAEIRWRPSPQGSIAAELSIAALVAFMRRQIEPSPPLVRVAFAHPTDEAGAAACAAFFGCPVEFSSEHTLVRFPTESLAVPMPQREPGLRLLLERQAQSLLNALPDPHAYDHALQQMLVRMLPEGDVTIERVAPALHQSVRSLQRRLAERGLSWQTLLDRTREQLARQYLRDRGLSIGEIALLLGYSEQSAFTRAFRRWTGQTPFDYRR